VTTNKTPGGTGQEVRRNVSKTKRSTAAGLRRADHFRNGGTIATWRGRARRITDDKTLAERDACRGRHWEDE